MIFVLCFVSWWSRHISCCKTLSEYHCWWCRQKTGSRVCQTWQFRGLFGGCICRSFNISSEVISVFVLVFVHKDSLRTKVKSLSLYLTVEFWCWSWSLALESFSWPWGKFLDSFLAVPFLIKILHQRHIDPLARNSKISCFWLWIVNYYVIYVTCVM